MKSGKRSFTLEASTTGDVGGRYINHNPSDAAGKAASKIFRSHPQSRSIRVQVRETTQGSDKKLYAYKAKKIMKSKEEQKKMIERGDVQISYTFSVELEPTPLFHGDGARKKM